MKQGQYLSYGRLWIYNQEHVAGSRSQVEQSSVYGRATTTTSKGGKRGKHIAFVRIHVERAIGRIKTFTILKHTEFLVCVCAYVLI